MSNQKPEMWIDILELGCEKPHVEWNQFDIAFWNRIGLILRYCFWNRFDLACLESV